jgi:hypothetical protein
VPYSAFRRSWMAENAVLTALELRNGSTVSGSQDAQCVSGAAGRTRVFGFALRPQRAACALLTEPGITPEQHA